MVLVHFPSALLPMDFVFSTLSLYLNQMSFATASYYCLWAGVAGGWAAIFAGAFDLVKYFKPGHPGIRQALTHATVQVTVIIFFTLILAFEYKHPSNIASPSIILIAGKALFLMLMVVGNYMGGELVLKYIAKMFETKTNS